MSFYGLYVDNILIICSTNNMIKSTNYMLNSMFDMKEMGLGDLILRIKIITLDGFFLS